MLKRNFSSLVKTIIISPHRWSCKFLPTFSTIPSTRKHPLVGNYLITEESDEWIKPKCQNGIVWPNPYSISSFTIYALSNPSIWEFPFFSCLLQMFFTSTSKSARADATTLCDWETWLKKLVSSNSARKRYINFPQFHIYKKISHRMIRDFFIYLRVEGVYHCNSGKNLLKQVRNALKVIGFTNTSEAPAAIAFSRSAVKA